MIENRIFHALLSLMILLSAGAALADVTVTTDNSEYKKRVLKYLQSDSFITEGVGLKRVYIGQSTKSLIKKMGKPVKEVKIGIFSGVREYVYKLDNETDLLVGIKNKTVQAIAVVGNFNSQYITIKGARFGMAPHEIRTLYGTGVMDKESLLYSNLGMRFDFARGQLRIIRVFPRKR